MAFEAKAELLNAMEKRLSEMITAADMTQDFTATITADTGYTLSSVVVKVGGSDKTSQYYSNGVVSVPSSAMTAGDILIVATAEANS